MRKVAIGMTALLACGAYGCGPRIEGTQAGDCEDAADNDADGLFDCNDDGCAGSPVCGGDTDADTDTDTDSDTDTDTDSDTDTDTDSDTDSDADYTVCNDGIAPYADIQDAVDNASDGDVINICAGSYASVSIDRVDVSLVGLDGAEATTIDGGTGPALTVDSTEVSVYGLTLTGRPGPNEAGALHASEATLTLTDVRVADVTGANAYAVLIEGGTSIIDHVTFEDNLAGGMVLGAWGGDVSVRHCLFEGNGAFDYMSSPALVGLGQADIEFANNLVVRNEMTNAIVMIQAYEATYDVRVYNNVLVDNKAPVIYSADAYTDSQNNIVAFNEGIGIGAATCAYSAAWGNTGGDLDWYTKNESCVLKDPEFTDYKADDYTLDAGFSPCIDAGNPMSGYNDPDGSRNDMGLYGGPHGSW